MQWSDLRPFIEVNGLHADEPVKVLSIEPFDTNMAQVVYRTRSGLLHQRVLDTQTLQGVSRYEHERMHHFDTNPHLFQCVLEAQRLEHVRSEMPAMMLYANQIATLPHQYSAVYEHMLKQNPLRFLLADDPGAGKTMMAGLYLVEFLKKNPQAHILILVPASVFSQWQEELVQKFNLHCYEHLSAQICCMRIDQVTRDIHLKKNMLMCSFDLVIFDEAHKLTMHQVGIRQRKTKRYQLAEELCSRIEHVLLMSATPHSGHSIQYEGLLNLLGSDYQMRRLSKESLQTLSGEPLFRERYARSIHYALNHEELEFYNLMTRYIQRSFKHASKHRSAETLALMTLQRRLASSYWAIYHSLQRRYENVHAFMSVEDQAILLQCIAWAKKHIEQGSDIKWKEFSKAIHRHFYEQKSQDKMIVFSEFRDTVDMLIHFIQTHFPLLKTLHIHGNMSLKERKFIQQRFCNEPQACLLIATDAAGEGINLQAANIVVNYDIPWNPNKIEQRFGRVHRIGQTKPCYLWNLISINTREGYVFDTLLKKLERENNALNGTVFDVLGQVLEHVSFQDSLFEALCSDSMYSSEKLAQHITDTLNKHLEQTPKHQTSANDLKSMYESCMLKPQYTLYHHHLKAYQQKAKALQLSENPEKLIEKHQSILRHGSCFQDASSHQNYFLAYVSYKDTIGKQQSMFVRYEENKTQTIHTLTPHLMLTPHEKLSTTPAHIDTQTMIQHCIQHAQGNIQSIPCIEAIAWVQGTKTSQVVVHDLARKKHIENMAMRIVQQDQEQAGYCVQDVSRSYLGYDLSCVSHHDSVCKIKHIEVKGRKFDATTVTLTRHELEYAVAYGPLFWLAIVLIDDIQHTHQTIYLHQPFVDMPSWGVHSITFHIETLKTKSERIQVVA